MPLVFDLTKQKVNIFLGKERVIFTFEALFIDIRIPTEEVFFGVLTNFLDSRSAPLCA